MPPLFNQAEYLLTELNEKEFHNYAYYMLYAFLMYQHESRKEFNLFKFELNLSGFEVGYKASINSAEQLLVCVKYRNIICIYKA